MHNDSRAFFEGKTVVVTGGTGSFGRSIVPRLLSLSVKEVRVFSRDEQKHVLMRREYADPRLTLFLGDVRDSRRVREVVRGANVVVHAAAIKHVHLTEKHPYEAVRTNIEGANNVLTECRDAGVEVLVAVSTDKAVQPVNVMGMSKAIQERIVCRAFSDTLRTGCVRYGNVIASAGSVAPAFKALLDGGARVLPVTDRNMTRFAITMQEAVDALLFACCNARAGEVFVPELPAFRVVDLADVMLRARGGGEMIFTGVRPGEKIHEVLVSSEELRRSTKHAGYYVVRGYVDETERFEDKGLGVSSADAVMLSKSDIAAMLEQEGML